MPRRRARSSAIGLGVPCLVDPRTRRGRDAVHLPLAGVAFRDLIAERWACRSRSTTTATCDARRVAAGAARGARDAVLLTIGTGIGGGLPRERRAVHGARGAARRARAHDVDPDGPPCPGRCPNHGCLEALVSGTALGIEGRAARRASSPTRAGRALAAGREITGALVTELALAGDAVARGATWMGARLGLGIASL